MAENNNRNPTHTAYGFRREGRKSGRWLEIGYARADSTTGNIKVFLDRLPIGGFTGGVLLTPAGQEPPPAEAAPQRPGQLAGDADADAELTD